MASSSDESQSSAGGRGFTLPGRATSPGGMPRPNKEWQLILLKSIEKRDSRGKAFTLYEIVVVTETGNSWHVYRRYSQFLKLFEGLKKACPNDKFVFPRKRLLDNMNPAFVAERRQQLSAFLLSLQENARALRCEELARFLSPDRNPFFSQLSHPDKEGSLKKRGEVRKTVWKTRWFVLKDSSLYYFKTMNDSDPRGVIPLHASTIERHNSSDREFCFELHTRDPKHPVYVLSADSEGDMLEWVNALQRAGGSRVGGSSAFGSSMGAGGMPAPSRGGRGAGPRSSFSGSTPNEVMASSLDSAGLLAAATRDTGVGMSLSRSPGDVQSRSLMGSSLNSNGGLGHSKSYTKVSALIDSRDRTDSLGGGSDSDIEFEEDDPEAAKELAAIASRANKEQAALSKYKARLTAGAQFLMHGVGPSAVPRHVNCSDALDYVLWEDASQGNAGFMPIKGVTSIEKGIQTKRMASTARPDDESLCFSLVAGDKTLDLQATTVKERDAWVEMLTKLLQVKSS